MNTRSLAARLKRLEFRRAPDYQRHTFDMCAVDSKCETLYRMRLGQPENQYFALDGRPIMLLVITKRSFLSFRRL